VVLKTRILLAVCAASLALVPFAKAIRPDPIIWPIIITPSATTINAGAPIDFEIGLNQTATSATTISLTSSHPQYLPVPSTVPVAASESSVELALEDYAVDELSTPTNVTITASAAGRSCQTVVTVQ
jgi:hypothetical protein